MEMNHDKYGEIINGPDTYKCIHDLLKKNKSVIVGWTDEKGSHYDILFTFQPHKEEYNMLQFGLRSWYLYVSIMTIGSFGFNSESIKESNYVANKLNILSDTTAEKFTELLNGIIMYEEEK